jgi:hypothetical protein
MRKRQDGQVTFPPDLVAYVHKEFGAEASEALAMLASSLPEAQRVLRCVVFLAKGNLEELSKLMTAAKTDYRDVIFWAEYVNHEAPNPKRVRDFNRPLVCSESPLPPERGPGRRRAPR